MFNFILYARLLYKHGLPTSNFHPPQLRCLFWNVNCKFGKLFLPLIFRELIVTPTKEHWILLLLLSSHHICCSIFAALICPFKSRLKSILDITKSQTSKWCYFDISHQLIYNFGTCLDRSCCCLSIGWNDLSTTCRGPTTSKWISCTRIFSGEANQVLYIVR